MQLALGKFFFSVLSELSPETQAVLDKHPAQVRSAPLEFTCLGFGSRHESRPKEEARLGLEASAGLAGLYVRGLSGGDTLFLFVTPLEPNRKFL